MSLVKPAASAHSPSPSLPNHFNTSIVGIIRSSNSSFSASYSRRKISLNNRSLVAHLNSSSSRSSLPSLPSSSSSSTSCSESSSASASASASDAAASSCTTSASHSASSSTSSPSSAKAKYGLVTIDPIQQYKHLHHNHSHNQSHRQPIPAAQNPLPLHPTSSSSRNSTQRQPESPPSPRLIRKKLRQPPMPSNKDHHLVIPSRLKHSSSCWDLPNQVNLDLVQVPPRADSLPCHNENLAVHSEYGNDIWDYMISSEVRANLPFCLFSILLEVFYLNT
ncbi:hypothetical protein BKA69DRAFT_779921 [Paraphysoderma sedebokerense]|nr:hypothetical protein BKA69DRAFT_779921 [Paraphysoderma sedebokerense]